MLSLNKLSSAIIAQGHDSSGMWRWRYLTILERNNKRTTIVTLYKACDERIVDTWETTVVKQQWLIIKKENWNEHPHKAVMTDIIKNKEMSKRRIWNKILYSR